MNNLNQNTGRPFRFPFDIDRRIFLILAGIFFVLAIKPINQFIFPRLTPEIISSKISDCYAKDKKEYEQTVKLLNANAQNLSCISKKKLEQLCAANWAMYIYHDDSLVLWTKSAINAHPDSLQLDTVETYSTKNMVGITIKKQQIIKGDTVTIVGDFPLYVKQRAENAFINSYFTFLNHNNSNLEDFGYRLSPILTVDARDSDKITVNIENTPRFRISEKSDFLAVTDKNFWRFFWAAVPFIMFGVSIHTYYKVSVKRNPSLYFTLLLLTIIVIRGLTYLWGFPDDFAEFHLFNPSLYAADGLNTSLGNVFINACLIFWALFFFIMNIQGKVLSFNEKKGQIIFIGCGVLTLFMLGFRTVMDIRSIINDGGLNFDTTNYNNISPANIIGLGTVLLLFMNYVMTCIIFNRYFETFFPHKRIKYALPLLGIPLAIIFLQPEILTTMIIGSVWTVIILVFFSARFLNTKFDFNSYKLIYWLIFLSLSCVLIIHYFDTEKEIKLRQDLAQKIIRFENKNTELKLVELENKLTDNRRNFDSLKTKKEIEEYITQEYLLDFEPEYYIHCEVLDNIYSDIYPNSEHKEFKTETNQILSNSTSVLSLQNESGSEQYELYVQLDTTAIIVKLLSPYFTKTNPENNPLLHELEHFTNRSKDNYDYAFYANDELVMQTSINRFPQKLSSNASKTNGSVSLKDAGGFSDVIAHTGEGSTKKSVIIRKESNLIYRISTTYAYVFTTIFILITLYILGNIIARSNLRRKRFVNLLGLTLRMRIHLSILLVELISLSIIGAVTIFILSSTAKSNALSKASIASEEIKTSINKLNSSNIDSLKIKLKQDQFMYVVNPYLQKHKVGLNIFGLDGERIFTSVSKKVSDMLPPLINPIAQYNLLHINNISSLQTQSIGKLEYYTIYSLLSNKRKETIGIIEIPNFSSQHSIKENNSRIITMLINIYAFVFLLSSLFAFYITKRLTNSFSKIVTQFSKINLTRTNEPLSWPYSDEIGLLIKEYNRTLRKLENSTALLAKSERELAWREMAKQIAHDIKNPLTPMSLSLQSLQSAIRRNDANLPELTERMTNTVLEQINVLTRTATNFSEFATLIDVDARRESLIDILESTTGIYSDNDEVEFLFILPRTDIFVLVDKVKIIRVITNVIQNAIQSIPTDRIGQIILKVTKIANNMVRISLEDNGEGIPKDLATKIFQPNFTTKSSGSGLGLAMCKDIMLKTGGNIYFTSKEGDGSKFHIELPEYLGVDDDLDYLDIEDID